MNDINEYKVYITSSNAKGIIQKLELSDFQVNDKIYKILINWFNSFEIKYLLALQLLYKNPEEFFQKYIIKENRDTKQYVYEGFPPAYHPFKDCERMLSSFFNYRIPEEIKKRGDQAIDEFRNWFKKEKGLLAEGKFDIFLFRMQIKFGLKVIPEIVDFQNSGVEIKENLDLNNLERKIDTLIKEGQTFCRNGLYNMLIFSNYKSSSDYIFWCEQGKNFDVGISKEKVLNILKEFETKYKEPVKFLLKEYYRVKYNPELEFKGELLDQLGFSLCSHCENKLLTDYR